MNKDLDLGKEKDFKRISWMKDRIEEERVGSVRMEKEGGQEAKNTLAGQEDNRRKEKVDLEDGFEGKRKQYLKGEVMEIDIRNQLERNTRISLKELDQNVIQMGENDKGEKRKVGQGKQKRMARIEGKEKVQKYEQNKENVRSNGIKRDWQHGDDGGEQQNKGGTGIRSKCQKFEIAVNSQKVEVASLKWPQIDEWRFCPRIVEGQGGDPSQFHS